MASGGQLFDAQRGTFFIFDPDDLVIIGYDTKHKKGEHPLYDERHARPHPLPIPEGMVENIIEMGVLQPIQVRKETHDSNKVVAVVKNGRFRLRAAREANKILMSKGLDPVQIRAIVVKGEDDWMVAAALAANSFTTEESPITRAQKIQRYLAYGHSEEEAGRKCGLSVSAVKQSQRLLELDPNVIKAVESGQITPTAADQLHRLSREAQVKELEVIVAAGGRESTVRAVTDRVARKKAAEKGEEKHSRPSIMMIRRTLEAVEAWDGDEPPLSPETINAFRYIMGEVGPRSVKGLSAVHKKLGFDK